MMTVYASNSLLNGISSFHRMCKDLNACLCENGKAVIMIPLEKKRPIMDKMGMKILSIQSSHEEGVNQNEKKNWRTCKGIQSLSMESSENCRSFI